MAKGKRSVKTTQEVVETTEDVKTTQEVVETPISTIEPRNFSVIVIENKQLAVIRKSEYNPNIHIAI